MVMDIKRFSLFLIREFKRLWIIFVVLGILVFSDVASSAAYYSFGIILLFTVGTHVTRKLLFPYIDMETVWNKANDTPMGAAIVFAAMCYLMSVLIQSSTVLVR